LKINFPKAIAKSQNFKGLDGFRQNRLEKRANIRTQSIFHDSKNVTLIFDFSPSKIFLKGFTRIDDEIKSTSNPNEKSHSKSNLKSLLNNPLILSIGSY